MNLESPFLQDCFEGIIKENLSNNNNEYLQKINHIGKIDQTRL